MLYEVITVLVRVGAFGLYLCCPEMQSIDDVLSDFRRFVTDNIDDFPLVGEGEDIIQGVGGDKGEDDRGDEDIGTVLGENHREQQDVETQIGSADADIEIAKENNGNNVESAGRTVITSYSIHYTKLYESERY